jgi:hypothetical protein
VSIFIHSGIGKNPVDRIVSLLNTVTTAKAHFMTLERRL